MKSKLAVLALAVVCLWGPRSQKYRKFAACSVSVVKTLAVLVLAVLAIPNPAYAQDTAIQYTFTSTNYANYDPYGTHLVTETFQFTSPTFILNDGWAAAPSLEYCSVTGAMVINGRFDIPTPCFFAAFLPSGPGAGGRNAEIDVGFYFWFEGNYGVEGGGNYFPLGSFSAVGEYDVVDSNSHYTAHLSVKVVPTPEFPAGPLSQTPPVNFRSFTANAETHPNGFEVNSQFALPSGSINHSVSDVVFRLGLFFVSIPEGSFIQKEPGYVYEGVVNGVVLHLIIKPLGNETYSIHMEGHGVDASNSSNPLYVALSIGNYSGAAVVTN
jgi:hypothetical protein